MSDISQTRPVPDLSVPRRVLDGEFFYNDYGPEIFGDKFTEMSLQDGKGFSAGVVGYGVGYYKSDFLIDSEKWRRWHGFGVHTAFSYKGLIGLLTATLSADANLGFGRGIAVNAGVGPTYSFGIPGANLILGSLIWGSLKVRGNVAISGEGDGYAGWGVNPEVGYSISILTLRWVFPSLGGGGDTEQGNSFFAGVSHGWP